MVSRAKESGMNKVKAKTKFEAGPSPRANIDERIDHVERVICSVQIE